MTSGEAALLVGLLINASAIVLIHFLSSHQRDKVAEALISTSTVVTEKLDQIHTLVDGNLTAAMQAELDAMERELAMMHEVVAMKQAMGHDPSPTAKAAIAATKGKIDEMKEQLKNRRIAQSKIVSKVDARG